jgi:uncharacterized protein YdaU (DUF1376 family)
MGDLNVQAMDWDERGVYFWLLCLCWCEETIPADPTELAKICRIPRKKFARNHAPTLALPTYRSRY